jgi:hypothetical protein
MERRTLHNLDRLILQGFVVEIDAGVDQADERRRAASIHVRCRPVHEGRCHTLGAHAWTCGLIEIVEVIEIRRGSRIDQTDRLLGLSQGGALWNAQPDNLWGDPALRPGLDVKPLGGQLGQIRARQA